MRFFLREQPVGTWIDDIEPWPKVRACPSVTAQNMDQCMTGAVDGDGLPVMKPTQWLANNPALTLPMQKFKCNRQHQHSNPTGKALEKLKVYPWRLCGAVETGIQLLKEKCARGTAIHTIYPAIGTGDIDVNAPLQPPKMPVRGLGCPACHSALRKTSPMHTRDRATCYYPDIASVRWECPSCQDLKGRNPRRSDAGHTFIEVECRFSDRGPPPRTGAHPREPREKATTHPSAEASSHDATREDPGVLAARTEFLTLVVRLSKPAAQAAVRRIPQQRPGPEERTQCNAHDERTKLREQVQADYRTGPASTCRSACAI